MDSYGRVNNSRYGDGHCKRIWIDHGIDRSVPVPDDLRRALGAGKRQ